MIITTEQERAMVDCCPCSMTCRRPRDEYESISSECFYALYLLPGEDEGAEGACVFYTTQTCGAITTHHSTQTLDVNLNEHNTFYNTSNSVTTRRSVNTKDAELGRFCDTTGHCTISVSASRNWVSYNDYWVKLVREVISTNGTVTGTNAHDGVGVITTIIDYSNVITREGQSEDPYHSESTIIPDCTPDDCSFDEWTNGIDDDPATWTRDGARYDRSITNESSSVNHYPEFTRTETNHSTANYTAFVEYSGVATLDNATFPADPANNNINGSYFAGGQTYAKRHRWQNSSGAHGSLVKARYRFAVPEDYSTEDTPKGYYEVRWDEVFFPRAWDVWNVLWVAYLDRKAERKRLKDKYDADLAQYLLDLAAYNAAMVQYHLDVAAYNAAMVQYGVDWDIFVAALITYNEDYEAWYQRAMAYNLYWMDLRAWEECEWQTPGECGPEPEPPELPGEEPVYPEMPVKPIAPEEPVKPVQPEELALPPMLDDPRPAPLPLPELVIHRTWLWSGDMEEPWSDWYVMKEPDSCGTTRVVNLMYKCYKSARLGVVPTAYGEVYEFPA